MASGEELQAWWSCAGYEADGSHSPCGAYEWTYGHDGNYYLRCLLWNSGTKYDRYHQRMGWRCLFLSGIRRVWGYIVCPLPLFCMGKSASDNYRVRTIAIDAIYCAAHHFQRSLLFTVVSRPGVTTILLGRLRPGISCYDNILTKRSYLI